jgi:four helix bundle protein
MFEFEKITVWDKSQDFYLKVKRLRFGNSESERIEWKQLIRASLSVYLNIAEGIGRSTKRDKRNFYVISRGSLYESMAIIKLKRREKRIDSNLYNEIYALGTQISKMLHALIKGLN